MSVVPEELPESRDYPFNLPWLTKPGFELEFTEPVTIIAGENGTGKSTLIEAIAAISGYDSAGGGKGYQPVDHSDAREGSGADLAQVLRAAWLPKITNGWFFRAESFFSVSRYLDQVGSPANYLTGSHGEGFLSVFEERMLRQGIYFLDEPESALSPMRQLELLRILNRIQESRVSQVIMATHSPILMALPGAQLLEARRHGLEPTSYRDIRHFKLYQSFTVDPEDFIARALSEDDISDMF